ncbi:MAG: hypothetical protein ABSG14_02985, partial [Verrucomicrobiia bacterium]
PYALILAVLVAGVLVELRRQPAMGFLGAWIFVILAPSSSVVPVAGQPMAEHRMYARLRLGNGCSINSKELCSDAWRAGSWRCCSPS